MRSQLIPWQMQMRTRPCWISIGCLLRLSLVFDSVACGPQLRPNSTLTPSLSLSLPSLFVAEKHSKHQERRILKTLQPGNVYIEENNGLGVGFGPKGWAEESSFCWWQLKSSSYVWYNIQQQQQQKNQNQLANLGTNWRNIHTYTTYDSTYICMRTTIYYCLIFNLNVMLTCL